MNHFLISAKTNFPLLIVKSDSITCITKHNKYMQTVTVVSH